ncbi:unnamed protein product, partial [Mesorhabditis spiculigera]
MFSFGTKCYSVEVDLMDYATAQKTCQEVVFKNSTDLAYIQTPEEMEYIAQEIDKTDAAKGQSRFWIGLNARDCVNCTAGAGLDQFGWASGQELDEAMSFFREGWPRPGPEELCVAYVQNDKTWVNTVCTNKYMAICWKDAATVIPTTAKPKP